jgi:hypothetical protein
MGAAGENCCFSLGGEGPGGWHMEGGTKIGSVGVSGKLGLGFEDLESGLCGAEGIFLGYFCIFLFIGNLLC